MEKLWIEAMVQVQDILQQELKMEELEIFHREDMEEILQEEAEEFESVL